MKIKYIHNSEPSKIKVYDTERALKNNPYIKQTKQTQSDFDKMELANMERDKRKGLILSYEIIQ